MKIQNLPLICLFSFLQSSLWGSSYLSIGAGSFDFYRERHRCFEFLMEYKGEIKTARHFENLTLRPLIGIMGTTKKSFYGYCGINFDLLFFDHLLFAPGFAAGYFAPGDGKRLGCPIEFRSGAELGWQFKSGHRFGLHFYHLSNASISRRNPGEESLIFFFDIPITQGFPFCREK